MAFVLSQNVSLKPFNTFSVDAKAAYFADVSSVSDLKGLFSDSRIRSLPRFVLGGGSNVLFTGQFDGLVIRMSAKGVSFDEKDDGFVRVTVAAGEVWHDVVTGSLARGIGGLENLSLIPGTIGGAAVQNIGAYGAEFSSFCESVTYFDCETLETVTLPKDACGFVYRGSVFKEKLSGRAVIVSVTLKLPKAWQPNLAYADVKKALAGKEAPSPREIGSAIEAIRRAKLPDPAVTGNAGSFFKNPVVTQERLSELKQRWPELPAYPNGDGRFRIAAGWMIDRCGLKGFSKGTAGVCETQALVLVNLGGATGKEIAELSAEVASRVEETFGIALEPETVFV